MCIQFQEKPLYCLAYSLNADSSKTGPSQREIEVLRLIDVGRSNPQIAEELVISLKTVQPNVSNILAKAAVYAKDHGLA